MARNLFINTDIPLGARVEFYYQWSKWIKQFDQRVQASPNSSLLTDQSNRTNQSYHSNESDQLQSLQSNQTIDLNKKSDAAGSTSVDTSEISINLKTIINSNTYGQSVLKQFNEKKAMNDNLRKMLCDSILQYCIENKHELSTVDCAKLTKQICSVFSGETAVYPIIYSFIH